VIPLLAYHRIYNAGRDARDKLQNQAARHCGSCVPPIASLFVFDIVGWALPSPLSIRRLPRTHHILPHLIGLALAGRVWRHSDLSGLPGNHYMVSLLNFGAPATRHSRRPISLFSKAEHWALGPGANFRFSESLSLLIVPFFISLRLWEVDIDFFVRTFLVPLEGPSL